MARRDDTIGLIDPVQRLRGLVQSQVAPTVDPTAPPPPNTAPTPSAPLNSTKATQPAGYYNTAEDLLHQGYTGAQAYGMAAQQNPTTAPSSAATYSQSPAFAAAAKLPRGQSVPPPPPTAPPAPAPFSGDPYQYFQSLIKGLPPSINSLKQIAPQLQAAGIRVISNDKIQLPNGQIVDTLQASDGPNPQWQWLTGDGGGAGAPGATAAAPPNPFMDQLRQLLQQRITNDLKPVDENAPEITAPLEAARNEAAQQTAQERTALAERLYAQGDGLNTGALTQQIQQSAEKNAGALGTLRANLIAQEYQQRRQDLSDSLQLAVASGDSESARAIQLAIANLDAAVQREGIGAGLAENQANNNLQTVLAGLNG